MFNLTWLKCNKSSEINSSLPQQRCSDAEMKIEIQWSSQKSNHEFIHVHKLFVLRFTEFGVIIRKDISWKHILVSKVLNCFYCTLCSSDERLKAIKLEPLVFWDNLKPINIEQIKQQQSTIFWSCKISLKSNQWCLFSPHACKEALRQILMIASFVLN